MKFNQFKYSQLKFFKKIQKYLENIKNLFIWNKNKLKKILFSGTDGVIKIKCSNALTHYYLVSHGSSYIDLYNYFTIKSTYYNSDSVLFSMHIFDFQSKPCVSFWLNAKTY